jgi:ACS family tartrate transporter-like MFS transporter
MNTQHGGTGFGAAVLRKVGWRLVPFLGLLYFFAFLDRVNVGFAALTMNEDIGLSAAAYGFGAGIFFIGYVIFEIPSNVILARVGARIWIARIMISWGLLSAATALVEGPTSFYVLRFLLGVAEAGFFPGIIYFLSCWFPSAYRARILGAFLFAIPLSSVLGAPLSTRLLGFEGLGLAGWQWMFILEGLPAALLGLAVLRWLRNRPADAEWLEPREREWLTAELARDGKAAAHHAGIGRVLANPTVWLFGFAYFGLIIVLYAFNFWLPQIVKGLGNLSNVEVGLVLMIPAALSGLAMVAWGLHSDRSGERRWHVALPAMLSAVALAASAMLQGSPIVAFLVLIVAGIGTFCSLPAFWTLPAALLTGPAAAAGIALVNSIGNVGGFVGPALIGYFKQTTGSYAAAYWALAVASAASALIVLAATRSRAEKTS